MLRTVFALLVVVASAGMWSGCARAPDGPNVVLVVLDTVRLDFTGPRANGSSHTPYLDRLAAEGTVFTNAWANAPWTVPSHASMFTGLLPAGHGCNSAHLRLDCEEPTLAELLNEAGYRTAAFYSNPWLGERTANLVRGFFVAKESPLAGFGGGPNPRRWDQGGQNTNDNVIRWLSGVEDRRPFFLFVNFLEAHLSYDPPPDYRRQHLKDIGPDDRVTVDWGHEFSAGLHSPEAVDWARVRGLYAGDVNTADRLLAGLIELLEKKGLYENTVIIVTSDHGENLGEHGLVEHQFSVHETLLAVPLVIRAPDILPVGRRDDPVMLTDVFATVLDCAGLPPDPVPRHSRSLLAPPPGPDEVRPLLAEYAGPDEGLLNLLRRHNPDLDTTPLARAYRTLRVGRLRLTESDDGRVWLYDLEADPGESVDLAGERPSDANLLRDTLHGLLGATAGHRGEPVPLDEETRAKLRSLGYVH